MQLFKSILHFSPAVARATITTRFRALEGTTTYYTMTLKSTATSLVSAPEVQQPQSFLQAVLFGVPDPVLYKYSKAIMSDLKVFPKPGTTMYKILHGVTEAELDVELEQLQPRKKATERKHTVGGVATAINEMHLEPFNVSTASPTLVTIHTVHKARF